MSKRIRDSQDLLINQTGWFLIEKVCDSEGESYNLGVNFKSINKYLYLPFMYYNKRVRITNKES